MTIENVITKYNLLELSNSRAAFAALSSPDGSKFDHAFGFGGSLPPLPSPFPSPK